MMSAYAIKPLISRVVFGMAAVFVAVTVLVSTSFSNFSLAAQVDHSLSYDQPATGTISDMNSEDRWTFNAPGQDAVSITVTRDEKDQPAGVLNTIVPELTLQDATGKVIAQAAHDPQTYDNAVIPSTVLPAAGTYTILVDRYQGQVGKTQGTYSMLVHLIGAGADRVHVIPELIATPTLLPKISSNEYVSPKTTIYPDSNIFQVTVDTTGLAAGAIGSIHNDNWGVLYFITSSSSMNQTIPYSIPAPFHIHARVDRLSGDLLPTIALIPIALADTQSGNPTTFHSPKLIDLPTPIATAMAGPTLINPVEIPIPGMQSASTSLISNLEATVTQGGEYALLISRQDAQLGTTTGQFLVGVSIGVPFTFDLRHIDLSSEPIEVGDVKTATINPFSAVPYGIDVSAPQTISIAVQRTSGNLLPVVWIEDATGRRLAYAATDMDTFSSATISKVQLPVGQYLIVVAGKGENVGVTNGDFTIKVSAVAP